MNRVEISGGLVRDPEFTYLGSGFPVMNLTVAVNEPEWSSQEKKQVVHTTYVAVSLGGSIAEDTAEKDLQKGDEVYVLGRLTQREVEKSDGSKERKTRVQGAVISVVRRGRPRAAQQPQQSGWTANPNEDPSWWGDGAR